MEDIIGYSLSDFECQKQARLCHVTDRKNGLDYASSAKAETRSSTKPWAQLFADDENEEMERMTLQAMQHMLRKSNGGSQNNEDSIEPASGNCSQSGSDSETPSSVYSEAPSVGIELLLEDSTSNSSDNMSLKEDPAGISSSCVISQGLLQGSSEDLPCWQKRASMDFESRVETENAEDDEWTLQKWKNLYHKQHSGRKSKRKHCKLQQEISESIGKACSSSTSLALDSSAGNLEVESSRTESSQDACFLSAFKVSKDNCGTYNSDCKHHERWASVKDPEIFAHDDSSQMSASSCSHSTVRLELEDDSEIGTSKASLPGGLWNTRRNGWALKSCNKVESSCLPNSALPLHAMLGCRTNPGHPSRKAGKLSNFNSDRTRAKESGQRMQAEKISSSHSCGNASSSKQQGITTVVQCMDDICKFETALSEGFRHANVNQVHVSLNEGISNTSTDQLEGSLSLKQSKGTDCLEQSHHTVSNGLPVFLTSLNCIETLEIEEEQEPQQKPAKIPCKRKAISPMSQEFLLKASKLGEFGVDAKSRGIKRLPLVFNEGWVESPKWTKNEVGGDNRAKKEFLLGKEQVLEALQSDASLVNPPEQCAVGPTSQHIPALSQKISPVSPNSPSKPENMRKMISPSGSFPLMPAKGILRSSCQGPCGCEECASVRSRAEKASEFSQRQMQDIEGLAVKLMRDLSVLRNIVEDRLIQSSVKHESPQPILSLEQLKKATANAAETEETAKKWLVRMARDCNRYCKIMRMQGRKLTFADESGGELCNVKVFHSEPCPYHPTGLHGRPLEANGSMSATPNEPAVEVVCSAEAQSDDKV